MKKLLALLATLVFVLVLAACGGDESENAENNTGNEGNADSENNETEEIESLTMGFIPSQEADEIADNVEPLEAYLTEELGITVEAEVMTDFVGLVEGMRTGQIDIGFINPFGYVQAVDRANVEIILKSIRYGSDTYVAQYLVPADSELESVEDIATTEGLSWAYPDILSTSGYLFPGAQLMDLGVEDLETFYTQVATGGHDNAALAVLEGQADFATTFDDARDTLVEEHPTIMEDLKIIGHTDPIPNDGIALRENFPEDLKQKVIDAFMAINDNEEVLAVMNEVYTWDGIAKAQDSDYDVVRSVYDKFEEQLSE
ncbi:phosphate/phosphite/phosphonate ABC transporter substrate-binding protein [Radiobacillus sp. PE A8.2]|uniref:phosphate/phosphite/phosphonate ABC transporter substrate-binding protein n=1 Tax=Radiobacillus sp. PE A8.2 TaxID=3380349 RepID=UPI0038901382